MKITKRQLVKLIKEQSGDENINDKISPDLLKFTRTLKVDSISRIRLNRIIQLLVLEAEDNTNFSSVQEKILTRMIGKVFNKTK